jgi:hypothetical protein
VPLNATYDGNSLDTAIFSPSYKKLSQKINMPDTLTALTTSALGGSCHANQPLHDTEYSVIHANAETAEAADVGFVSVFKQIELA